MGKLVKILVLLIILVVVFFVLRFIFFNPFEMDERIDKTVVIADIESEHVVDVGELVEEVVEEVSEPEFVEEPQLTTEEQEYKDKALVAFEYINDLRVENGVEIIPWDERQYTLARDKSKDMVEKVYFAHTRDDGVCSNTIKKDYGFADIEILIENIFQYHVGWKAPADPSDAVTVWMKSPGHKANLLHDGHINGAVACYQRACTFLGMHEDLHVTDGAKCFQ